MGEGILKFKIFVDEMYELTFIMEVKGELDKIPVKTHTLLNQITKYNILKKFEKLKIPDCLV